MKTWVISDIHFGHKNVHKFRTQFSSELEHREHIIDQWNSKIKKGGDRIFVLGDAAFTLEGLDSIKRLTGKKYLIRGNHDTLPTNMYLAYFEEVYGIIKYKNTWLSHAPIHPDELRRLINVHGHTHFHSIQQYNPITGTGSNNPRYINVCPESIGYAPVLFEDLVEF